MTWMSGVSRMTGITWVTGMIWMTGMTRGGSYFPYILLSEIQTMFSQLAKQSARAS